MVARLAIREKEEWQLMEMGFLFEVMKRLRLDSEKSGGGGDIPFQKHEIVYIFF